MNQAAVDYLPILLFFAIAVVIGAVTLTIGVIVRPSRPTAVKKIPYECGNIPVGDARVQVRARYYLFAMLLVLFDVEVVFLFPWAVNFSEWMKGGLGLFMFVEMMIFIGILLLGYIYVWRNGGLEWD